MDLPGYGGSDGLPQYDATTVLETITAFILCMREEYTGEAQGSPTERGKVIIVSHDWGAAIAFRLAAEAPQLADRFITSSVFLVSFRQWRCTYKASLVSFSPNLAQ